MPRLTCQEKYAASLQARHDPLAEACLDYTAYGPGHLFGGRDSTPAQIQRFVHLYDLGNRLRALRRAQRRRMARDGVYRPEFV